VSLLVILIH